MDCFKSGGPLYKWLVAYKIVDHLISGESLGDFYIHWLVLDYLINGGSLVSDHLNSADHSLCGTIDKWWIT